MSVAVSYPGVYVEEVPSGVRTIAGVATSIAAFVGGALKGPVGKPVTITSYADFERTFGGLWANAAMGYAVRDFYNNGGTVAVINRLAGAGALASAPVVNGKQPLTARAAGSWGKALRVTIDADIPASNPAAATLFNLTITELRADGSVLRREQFKALSLDPASARRVDKVIGAESQLVRWQGALAGAFDVAALHANDDALAKARKTLTDELAAPAPNASKIAAASDAVAAAQAALDKVARDDVQLAELALTAKRSAFNALRLAATPDAAKVAAAKDAVDAAVLALNAALEAAAGSDGKPLVPGDFLPPSGEAEKKGLYALEDVDLVNLLCLLPDGDDGRGAELTGKAAAWCERHRAMLLVDPLRAWNTAAKARDGAAAIGTASKNAALFFPMLIEADPMRDNQLASFAPCGAVAGIYARTDSQRGVWKAPAGLDAALVGVQNLSVPLTDAENGLLNPLGVNCLRTMPAAGRVVWGARTLQGDDRLASEWKYIPVRRTALYIEESLYRGTQWVVFEPNDEPLWAQIRLAVGAFMHDLFRQGAFQGKTPQEAYFVRCDKETTTQNDINLGIVNIAVGFAPLKPAEFVVIKLQQIAGQVQS